MNNYQYSRLIQNQPQSFFESNIINNDFPALVEDLLQLSSIVKEAQEIDFSQDFFSLLSDSDKNSFVKILTELNFKTASIIKKDYFKQYVDEKLESTQLES